MRHLLCTAALTAAIASTPAHAATVLYDAALGSPISQGLTYLSIPFTNFYTSTATSTVFNTSASNGIYAGFGTAAVPLPHGNFTLRFDLKIVSSAFANPNRSGFDVIAIDDTGKGIELAFRTNEIFSLGEPDAFPRVDVAAFDTTTAITRYDLSFSATKYVLRANGTQVLTGLIRDYSAVTTIPQGFPNPYITPNSIFLGDDTTSAGGIAEFSYVAVVPEPGTLAAMGGLMMVASRRRR